MKRNLSGIYIWENIDGKREPTCFEDCSEETKDKWLKTLTNDQLKDLAKKLAGTIKEIGDQFDIIKE